MEWWDFILEPWVCQVRLELPGEVKAHRVCGVEFNGGVGHHTEAVGVPGAVGVTCRFKPYRVYGVQFNGAVGAVKGELKLFLTL